VGVPAAEFDSGDVGPGLLAQDAGGRSHQRRNPSALRASSRHRLLTNDVLLLNGRLEPALQLRIGAIEDRQSLEVLVADCPQLRGRPRLHLVAPRHRAGHPRSDSNTGAFPRHDLQESIQPPVRRTDRPIQPRLQNRLAIEMAAGAVRNRHRMQDDQFSTIPELAQRSEAGCEAEDVVQGDEITLLERK
jgi:hypothetical protein